MIRSVCESKQKKREKKRVSLHTVERLGPGRVLHTPWQGILDEMNKRKKSTSS